ncbi:4743_t:CDS:1, partial [Ambispora leptoticha]
MKLQRQQLKGLFMILFKHFLLILDEVSHNQVPPTSSSNASTQT